MKSDGSLVGRIVGLVIVGTNDGVWLPACLGSVRKLGYRPLRVVYVDNASTDGSSDLVRREFPEVTCLALDANYGFAYANNRAIELLLGEGVAAIMLLNPDTITSPDMISDLVMFLETHPEFGIVGPLQLEYDSDSELNDWSKHALANDNRGVFHHWRPHWPSYRQQNQPSVPGVLEHAYVQGAALMARSEVWTSVGLLDEFYETFYEETDFCRRAQRAGWRIGLKLDQRVRHKGAPREMASWSPYRRGLMRRNRHLFLWTCHLTNAWDALRLSIDWELYDLKQARTMRQAVAEIGQIISLLTALLWLAPAIVRRRWKTRKIAAA